MQKEIYVLTGRCGLDMLGTSVSVNLGELQKEMQAAYGAALNDLDGDYEDKESGTSCGDLQATIVTSGDWYEWVISTHIIKVDDAISFTLPNGVVIAAKANVDGADKHRNEWRSIEITAVHRNGAVDTLCAVDWEARRGVNALVFEHGDNDPVYIQRYKYLDGGNLRMIDNRELAAKICLLPNKEELSFYTDKDENGGIDKYGAKKVDAFEATHIILNYYGGSSPYLVDLTVAENDVLEMMSALAAYFDHCGIEAPIYFDDNFGEAK